MTWEVLIPKKLLKEKETIRGFWLLEQEAGVVLKILAVYSNKDVKKKNFSSDDFRKLAKGH